MDTKTYYYAGIGSRSTPLGMLKTIELVSEALSADGMVLRSGHAEGADQAFERGAGPFAQIFLPWNGFNGRNMRIDNPIVYATPSKEAYAIAKEHHPAWDRLSDGAKKLHARNSHIILGPKLDDPVEFVLCWAALDYYGRPTGGTAQGIRIANAYDVPCYNFFFDHDLVVAEEWISTYEREMAKISS